VAGEPEAQMGEMAAGTDGAVEIDWSADDLGLAATPDETDTEEPEDEGAEGEAEGGATPAPEMRQTTQEPAAGAAEPDTESREWRDWPMPTDRYDRLERQALAGNEAALEKIRTNRFAVRLWERREAHATQQVVTTAEKQASDEATARTWLAEQEKLGDEDPVRFRQLLKDETYHAYYYGWRSYFGNSAATSAERTRDATLRQTYDRLLATQEAMTLDDDAYDRFAPQRYAGQPTETALAQMAADFGAAVAAASVRREAAPVQQRARAVEGRAETVRAAIAASPPPLPASQAPVRKTPMQATDDWINNQTPETRAGWEAVRNRLFSRG
jgi:hypothetical protein